MTFKLKGMLYIQRKHVMGHLDSIARSEKPFNIIIMRYISRIKHVHIYIYNIICNSDPVFFKYLYL